MTIKKDRHGVLTTPRDDKMLVFQLCLIQYTTLTSK